MQVDGLVGITLSIAAVVGLAVGLHAGFRNVWPLFAVSGFILGPVALLSFRDLVLSRVKLIRIELTDQRLIACRVNDGQRVGESVQLGRVDLTHFECKSRRSKPHGVIIVTGDVDEGMVDDEELDTHQIAIEFEDDADAKTIVHLLSEAAASARGHGQYWNGVPTASILNGVNATAEMPFELIAGETILWSGRPTFHRRVDAMRRLRAIARNLPFSITAVGVIVWLRPWQPPLSGFATTVVVVACLTLWFGVHTHLWSPIFERRKLRRTDYVLTNLRLAVREQMLGGSTICVSFYDAATTANVKLFSDGRGDVTLGTFNASKLERIPDAVRVYEMVERTLAMWREKTPRAAEPA